MSDSGSPDRGTGLFSSVRRGTQKLLLAVFGPPDLDHGRDPIEQIERDEARAREARRQDQRGSGSAGT